MSYPVSLEGGSWKDAGYVPDVCLNSLTSISQRHRKDVADILSGATVGARTGLKVGLLELQSLEA